MDLLQRAAAEPREARACLEAALRAAGDRLWVRRNAARIYREVVDDVAAARRVLGELAPLTGIEWRLAAAAWVELGDRTAATGCLERAAANARTAPDQCMVALGYLDAGFADEARLLVDGAAELATRVLDVWTVANLYRDAFGDRALALATLDRARLDATAVGELVTLAHALATYHVDAAQLDACLAAAERRASTVHGWIEVALGYHTIRLDGDAAQRCLAEASRLAASPQDERDLAIAAGRVGLELLDDERPRLAPGKLLRAGTRSFGWDRDPARLLGWLRARLPRTSLDALVRPTAYFVHDDLRELLGISKTGLVPHPLPAYLDVLDEVRWQAGPDVDHLTRAFACTLLLIDDAASTVPGGDEPTIAILLESCIALGPEAVEGALALFAALAEAYDVLQATTRMAYLVLFAELGLLLAAAWLDPSDPRIAAVFERLVADEMEHRHRLTALAAERSPPHPTWLLGLSSDDRRDVVWRSLAFQVLDRDPLRTQLVGVLVQWLGRLTPI